jgi:hypothetical protein
MDLLLTLILSCSVHFDDHLVEALAMKMSMSNQYFVGNLSTLDTYDNAHSVEEARRLVDAITAKGGRPAVGFMAVPVTWASRFGRTTEDLFDGCVNIGVATAMLSEYEHACSIRADHQRTPRRSTRHSRRNPARGLRHCILRRLEIDLNMTGVTEHVLAELAKLEGTPADHDVDPPPARAPLFPDNTDTARLHENTDWSSPRLFLNSSAAEMSPELPGLRAQSASPAAAHQLTTSLPPP